MKLASIFGLSCFLTSAGAYPSYGDVQARQIWEPKPWTAPGPNDGELDCPEYGIGEDIGFDTDYFPARGPCPGLNTLANHGYLPSIGRGITRDMLADAMLEGFNIAKSDAIILFTQAVRTNPAPFARTFDLDTLGREGVLEHDFSLR
jgi:hypothetical protein